MILSIHVWSLIPAEIQKNIYLERSKRGIQVKNIPKVLSKLLWSARQRLNN